MGAPHPLLATAVATPILSEKFFAAPSAQIQRRLLGHFDKG
jgi:hypothetical protein